MWCHDNRNRSRGGHGGRDPYGIVRDNDIDALPDELFSELLGEIASPFGIAILNRDVLAFRIAKRV